MKEANLLTWLGREGLDPSAPSQLADDGGVVSRRSLSQAVRATRVHLRRKGISPEHRLALVMPPGPDLATSLLGAMAVTAQLGLPVLRLDPFALPDPGEDPGDPPSASQLALLLQTSGTTSRPKVVPLSHANLWASAHSVAEVLALGPGDRSLAAIPLFHIHGIVASLLAPLLAGGSVICCQSTAPDCLLAAMESLQPTWLSAVPTLLQGLLAELERRPQARPAHRLRLLRSSSSPLPPPVLERLELAFGVPVIEAYGMTEAAHQICSNRLPGSGSGRQPGSVGAAAGPEVAVLGPDRQPRPAGESGEVAIRMLAVLDTGATTRIHRRLGMVPLLRRLSARFGTHLGSLLRLSKGESRLRFLQDRSQGLNDLLVKNLHVPVGRPLPSQVPSPTTSVRVSDQEKPAGDCFAELLYLTYRPQRLSLRVAIFAPEARMKILQRIWRFYAREGLSLPPIFADHFDFIQAERVGELAHALEVALEDLEETES